MTESKRRRPNLPAIITHLRWRLAPLHPEPAGHAGPPHPSFPATLLHFNLLTEGELDSIAQYYHQNPTSPTVWTYAYPENMNWDDEFLDYMDEAHGGTTRIDAKRRKVGKFIGLRGCETPTEEVFEKEQWARRKRERAAMKSTCDLGFLGRRGFGQW